ncbi:MAG TPA: DUF4304 domain-containing protein [Nocardioides sp.]|nr:DUF4304 domain-containing protein [Nocardioides sp.]
MDDKWLAWRTRRKVKADEVAVTAQSLYDLLVKEHLSPGLRALGFKGSGGRYALAGVAPFALLGLQKSAYSDAAEVQFTANLTVVSEDVWQTLRSQRPHYPERPSPGTRYGDRVPQARIGALTPSGEDKWWRVTSPELLSDVASDVLHDVEVYGVPWMRSQLGAAD